LFQGERGVETDEREKKLKEFKSKGKKARGGEGQLDGHKS
jgi:hypothetical protein